MYKRAQIALENPLGVDVRTIYMLKNKYTSACFNNNPYIGLQISHTQKLKRYDDHSI